jgi:flavin reductase (DIM6/NTAB) family NADH-FMN oxidoreductase RutF
MNKVALGPQTLIYPMPAMLVGANVDGKPNFMAVAWGGIACSDPPMISVAIRHARHTLKGIKQNQTFSVNIPSVEQVKETDYCGMVSGSRVDKVAACRFKVFNGRLASAPLIEQCPVNLECSVVQILNLGSHSLVLGRIEETHVSEDCLTKGKPDVDKIRPLAYVTSPAARYQGLGEVVGKAWSVGQKLT